MPTGTLLVNTETNIEPRSNDPNNCSLIFLWRSKSKTLSVPDKLLLQKPQSVSSLPIYVDFLPALESRKHYSATCDEHGFFIVPKRCKVCRCGDSDHRWRQSLCIAELYAFKTEMSDNHRSCYQIMGDAFTFSQLPYKNCGSTPSRSTFGYKKLVA